MGTSLQRGQQRRRVVQKRRFREFAAVVTFEYGELVPEGEDSEAVSLRLRKKTDHGEDGEDEFARELTLVAWRNLTRQQQRPVCARH
jgi:hypothetical protein